MMRTRRIIIYSTMIHLFIGDDWCPVGDRNLTSWCEHRLKPRTHGRENSSRKTFPCVRCHLSSLTRWKGGVLAFQQVQRVKTWCAYTRASLRASSTARKTCQEKLSRMYGALPHPTCEPRQHRRLYCDAGRGQFLGRRPPNANTQFITDKKTTSHNNQSWHTQELER